MGVRCDAVRKCDLAVAEAHRDGLRIVPRLQCEHAMQLLGFARRVRIGSGAPQLRGDDLHQRGRIVFEQDVDQASVHSCRGGRMSANAPLIGITAHEGLLDDGVGVATRHHLASVAYVKAVRKAGGMPVLLPMGDAADAEAAVARVDGVLVTGGADVNPECYGAATIAPETKPAEPARDAYEIAVVNAAVRADVPLLCICRGIQVMNVALGGTLHQHHDDHSDIARYNEDAHAVRIEAGSVLANALGATQVGVNSLHHQTVATVARSLRAVAFSEDGLVEGVEARGCTFAVGVQWHPEFLRHRPEHLALFEALVAAGTS